MGRKWYEGVTPVTVTVNCSGVGHRVVWREGRLSFPDHDLQAEAVLRALGGEAYGCSAVLDAWRTAFATDTDVRTSKAEGLPPAVAELRQLAWLASLDRRWYDPALPAHTRRQVHDIVVGRLRAAVEQSLAATRSGRPRLRVAIAVRVVASSDQPSVVVTTGPRALRLELDLPLPWLVGVWAHRVEVVDGHVALALSDPAKGSAPARLGAVLLGWGQDRHGGLAATVRRAWLVGGYEEDGQWRVDDRPGPPPARPALWWSIEAGGP